MSLKVISAVTLSAGASYLPILALDPVLVVESCAAIVLGATIIHQLITSVFSAEIEVEGSELEAAIQQESSPKSSSTMVYSRAPMMSSRTRVGVGGVISERKVSLQFQSLA